LRADSAKQLKELEKKDALCKLKDSLCLRYKQSGQITKWRVRKKEESIKKYR
jgi:hypothetical protein